MYKIIYHKFTDCYNIYSTDQKIKCIQNLFLDKSVPNHIVNSDYNYKGKINFLYSNTYWDEERLRMIFLIGSFHLKTDAEMFLNEVLIPITIAYKLTGG